ncbi:MAG: hypothetical protein GFH27_549289n106 [Chloroflexi bacterium AL-W]|nr:hypothetical protein [Chloroflexi bacterium AL-N1]NOK66838.1 hypothetical protein [Chloroflexi bacterium AL-N10]NOK74870.1 hypothetical protein [Chloroflexi bacterium AL-N5]NOK81441.1 hypothetical protein [Chloroflexi bacterium AL-W]NOK88910.1 hypothetical protein [Chloroflexi bacterium AL-N15]
MELDQKTASRIFKVSVFALLPLSTLFLCSLYGVFFSMIGNDEDVWIFLGIALFFTVLYITGIYLIRFFYLTSKGSWNADEYKPWFVSTIFNGVSLVIWLFVFGGSLVETYLIGLIIGGLFLIFHIILLVLSILRM